MKLLDHIALRQKWEPFLEELELSGVHDVFSLLFDLTDARSYADAITIVHAAGGSVPLSGFPSDAWGSSRHQQIFYEIFQRHYTAQPVGHREPVAYLPRAHWFQDREFLLVTDELIEITQSHDRERRHRYVRFTTTSEGVLVFETDPDRAMPSWLRDEIDFAAGTFINRQGSIEGVFLRVTDELGDLIPF